MRQSRFFSLRTLRAAIGLFWVAGSWGLAQAQVTSVDPNSVFEVPAAPQQPQAATPGPGASAIGPMDVPLQPPAAPPASAASPAAQSAASAAAPADSPAAGPDGAAPATPAAAPAARASVFDTAAAPQRTHSKDDLIGAAEGVFGKGAKGLAEILEKILADQGEPNAYIAGREASGAFMLGLRYGSGTLVHTVEGQRPVYWTGPSLGFDVGGDATKTFVLIYNLYDSQDLYRRYAQVEGRAYFVGGLSATYLRRGDVAIIPIRMGVGMRLGANVGYMKFTEKSRWLPF